MLSDPVMIGDCLLHVKIWIHVGIKKNGWERGKKWGWGRNKSYPDDDSGQGRGAECKRDENKDQWLYNIYFSYLPKAAFSNDMGKENLFDAVLLVSNLAVHSCILFSSVFSGLSYHKMGMNVIKEKLHWTELNRQGRCYSWLL